LFVVDEKGFCRLILYILFNNVLFELCERIMMTFFYVLTGAVVIDERRGERGGER
jgi:hypothetical protein